MGLYDYRPYVKRISNDRQIMFDCNKEFRIDEGNLIKGTVGVISRVKYLIHIYAKGSRKMLELSLFDPKLRMFTVKTKREIYIV